MIFLVQPKPGAEKEITVKNKNKTKMYGVLYVLITEVEKGVSLLSKNFLFFACVILLSMRAHMFLMFYQQNKYLKSKWSA